MRTGIAVVVGFLVWSVVWLGGNAGLVGTMPDRYAADGSTTDPLVLVLALGLSIVCSLLGGAIGSKVAGGSWQRTGWILAVLLLAVGVAVQAGYWNVMPLWYHLVFLALIVPTTRFGARLGAPSSSAVAA